MNAFSLQTKRTYMQPLCTEDAAFLYELNSDEKVTQFTGDTAFSSIKEAEMFLQKYTQFQEFGLGRMVIIHKETNEKLGWCGIKFCQEIGEYDIGFRLLQKYWNQGFATETALEQLRYGFQDKNTPKIVGRAMLLNVASLTVLQKIGMTKIREQEFALHEGALYEITKEEFKNFCIRRY